MCDSLLECCIALHHRARRLHAVHFRSCQLGTRSPHVDALCDPTAAGMHRTAAVGRLNRARGRCARGLTGPTQVREEYVALACEGSRGHRLTTTGVARVLDVWRPTRARTPPVSGETPRSRNMSIRITGETPLGPNTGTHGSQPCPPSGHLTRLTLCRR